MAWRSRSKVYSTMSNFTPNGAKVRRRIPKTKTSCNFGIQASHWGISLERFLLNFVFVGSNMLG